jgi:hypothetical protein
MATLQRLGKPPNYESEYKRNLEEILTNARKFSSEYTQKRKLKLARERKLARELKLDRKLKRKLKLKLKLMRVEKFEKTPNTNNISLPKT